VVTLVDPAPDRTHAVFQVKNSAGRDRHSFNIQPEAPRLLLHVDEEAGSLRLNVEGVSISAGRILHLEDRVGAVGGRVNQGDHGLDVELPIG